MDIKEHSMTAISELDHLINSAFSIHFVIERDLIIRSTSNTLRRFMPAIEGQPLLTAFQFQRPSAISSFDDIMSTDSKMALLETCEKNFAIRGQFIGDIGGTKCRFVGSPWLAWMTKNKPEVKMKLRDFSAIDPQLDQLVLLSTERQNLADLEQLTVEIKQAHEKTKISYQAQADFFAIMSHEMRTPLNGVAMALELIDKGQLSEESNRMHSIATQSSDNLKNVIDSVLDYSKLQSGGFSNEVVAFDINACVDTALTIIEAKAKQKNVLLIKKIDCDQGLGLIGDEPKIRQVLINLLSNAIKFTSEGSITVSAKLSNNETQLSLAVEDTGAGIPAHIKSHIFKPFWTIDQDKSDIGSGTGLGLNICHRMVDIMGGHIDFNSKFNIGTRFSFGIPIEKSQSSPNIKYDYQQTNQNQFTGKILLAEDNQINQQLMTKILQKRGVDVDVVSNGEEAISQIAKMEYDLIFMDISMPVMDGITATRILRENHALDNLPIIALTAHAGQDKAGEFLATGMNAVMNKPIDGGALNLILGQWLSSTQQLDTTANHAIIEPTLVELINSKAAAQLVADIGIEAYQDIAEMFEQECRKCIETINADYNELNFDDVAKTSHAILSSARSLGAEKLGQHLKSLEQASMTASTSEMNVLISTLSLVADESLIALDQYANSLTR
jgi:signal transduction histidine kinase/DNA-binding NarL/FixJ family response regulator